MSLKPGSRLFWNFHKTGHWYMIVVGELIVWRTGFDEVHEAISPDGVVWYEETVTFEPRKVLLWTFKSWPHGGWFKHNVADGSPWDYVMEPIVDVPEVVQRRMIAYAEEQIALKRPYNILQLIAMLWIWPMRWFYRWFGRIPFSAPIYGEYCSVAAEDCWVAGWAAVRPEDAQFSPPGEVAQSDMLRKV